MIEYTRRTYRAGNEVLCYVTDAPVVSVTCTCFSPDRVKTKLSFKRLTPNVFIGDIEFRLSGNYILVAEADGEVTAVVNAKVDA